jgi:hypothetical protein
MILLLSAQRQIGVMKDVLEANRDMLQDFHGTRFYRDKPKAGNTVLRFFIEKQALTTFQLSLSVQTEDF